MKAYLAKMPRIIMRIFSNYTWHFFSNKKEIFLTFDDGPTTDITQFILKELKKYNAKATFFCIGKNIKNHPELFKEIISEGHSIGNHTHNHLKGWKTEKQNYIDNILMCDKTITQFGYTTKQKLFRPPYGRIKKNQAKELIQEGYKIIMWDVLSADFDVTISKEKCLDNVLKSVENGSIIVFHDSVKAKERMEYVLPKVLKDLSEKGFTFKAIKS
ncbi:polysaccharide deacetylase family protein [Polaribacter sargassicola]|uniref:polysaccharide deacetylase family protein n=1 Tax=Polaribacter sargassicola TaxID=2836891 RepID=UPI001F1D9D33|nr:polysaccharide deacetylase family protein [Polaribacter sp. DS7-9]MCG1034843.1 polysaccharide deacetylase family protein [Polaribacter sp. DS7-9]